MIPTKVILEMHRIVYAYYNYRIFDKLLVEDLTSEVMYKLVKHHKKFNGDYSKLDRYAIRAAKTTLYDHINANKHPTLSIHTNSEDMSYVYEIPDNQFNPLNNVHGKQIMKAVYEGMKDIPFKYRKCNELYFLKDMKTIDIGKRLNKPENSVKVYVHKGRKILKEKLKDYRLSA